MKKFSFLLIMTLLLGAATRMEAQVTIGSAAEPNANAVLDLVATNRGLLLPRIALTATTAASPLAAHVEGMTVYNTATASSGATYVSPGFYYNDGFKWVRLYLGYNNWFYMPSVPFSTTSIVDGLTKDLYDLYKSQFLTPRVASNGAPTSVPYLPAATDLYYYVTDYDTNVFTINSISSSGVINYNVKSNATDYSFINIVFVLK